MTRALFVGISSYPPGSNRRSQVQKDFQTVPPLVRAAIARTRQQPPQDDWVKSLSDRPCQEVKAAIQSFFEHSDSEPIILLLAGYFLQAADGQLYFPCHDSVADDWETLISADFLQKNLDRNPARVQLVILDCDFRQSFIDQPVDETREVEIWQQLGSDRRVILTATIAPRHVTEPATLDAGSYTSYLAEGLETGIADTNGDGMVSAIELHNYAKAKLHLAAPAMTPQILTGNLAEITKVPLLAIPTPDAKLHYRQLLETLVAEGETDATDSRLITGRAMLKDVQESLNLSPAEAGELEFQALRPKRDYRRRLQLYREGIESLGRSPADAGKLLEQQAQQQQALHLTDENVLAIAATPYFSHQQAQRAQQQQNLALYEQVYLAALQRQNPLSDRDRQVLQSLKQVLHLSDQDTDAAGQTVIQVEQLEGAAAIDPGLLDRALDDRVGDHHPVDANPFAKPLAPGSFSRNREVVMQLASNPVDATMPAPLAATVVNSPQDAIERERLEAELKAREAAESQRLEAELKAKEAAESQRLEAERRAEEARERARERRQLGLLAALFLTAFIIGFLAFLYYTNRLPNIFAGGKRNPQAAQQFNQWGQQKAEQGYNREAVTEYSKAIDSDPQNAAYYINRGVAYHRLGDVDAAIRDFDSALANNPRVAIAYSNRSHAYFDKKDFQRAFDDGNRATVFDPKLPEAYLNLANARFATNDLKGALDDYNRAISLNPPKPLQAIAYTNRGNVIARTTPGAAVQNYNQALQSNPEYAEAYYNRAAVRELQGDRPAAIQDFQRAAELYLRQGKNALSEESLKRSQNLQPSPATSPISSAAQPANTPTIQRR
jgi:tetratricopeptide (TPR) repeat protein